MSVQAKLQDFFKTDEAGVEVLLENIRQNLGHGNFKFCVLMDSLHDHLKDLIIFINQNSRFDIFAVEIEYYKYKEMEIMIPKLFGSEVKKEVSTGPNSQRRQWSEGELLQDAKEKLLGDYGAFEKLYRFCKSRADKVNFGTGSSYGSFSPIFVKLSSKSLFTVGTDKRFSVNFGWVSPDNEQSAELLKQKLEEIGFSIPKEYKTVYPAFRVDQWAPKVDDLMRVLKEII